MHYQSDGPPAVYRPEADLPGSDAMLKTCRACGEEKPLDDFPRNSRVRSGRGTRCKRCNRDAMRRKRAEDPHYARASHLRTRYRTSREEYVALFEAQGGRCAICGTTEPRGNGTLFHIDHDHATGAVRGLLCRACNTGIGSLGDDVDRLLTAVAYLLTSEDVLGSARC